MFNHPDIETLRAWLERDQQAFQAQRLRLDEIQRTKAEDLTPADRNAVFNWDSSVIKTCEHHLEIMDQIEAPTPEQKQIKQALGKLVFLGDHIKERRNLVRDELEEKMGKVDMTPASLETNAAAPHTYTSASSTSKPEHEQTSQAEAEQEQEDTDPKSLYQILKVEPDASLEVIKKAIKRQRVQMHPDRNPGDAAAGARFADFQAACRVFDNEDMGREFDTTGRVRQIEDLSARLRALTTGQ